MKISIKIILIIGITALIMGGWMFVSVPELKKLPVNFESITQEHSHSTRAMNVGGPLIDVVDRELLTTMKSKDVGNNTLEITVVIGQSDPNKEGFTSKKVYLVDRLTKKHVNEDSFFMFPSNIKKQNYEIKHPSVSDTNLFVFVSTEKLFDLETYVFSCENFGTDIAGTIPRFVDMPLFYDGACTVWVEPKTGNEVKFEQSWNVYTIVDGSRIDLTTGNKQNSEYASNILVISAKNKIQIYEFYEYVIPILLGMISSGVLIIIFSYMNSRQKNKIILKMKDEQIKSERLTSIGQLASRMAHDIRNPLTIIKIRFELFKEQKKDQWTQKDLKDFESINKSINRISHQVDNVLDFVTGKPISTSRHSVRDIVDSAIKDISKPEKIKITTVCPNVEIDCDFEGLRVVLINLITNAIQAVGKEGIVMISIHDKIDHLLIKIEDSGPGIPKKNLQSIFEPLFTTKQEGTGLGLASVKSIIDLHKGSISVTSPPTIFTITLPKTIS